MSDLKIVIVGAGFAARVVHLPGYSGNHEPVAAICDLEENGLRPMLISAVVTATNRSSELNRA